MEKLLFSFIFMLLNTVCMSQKSGEQMQTHSNENKQEKTEQEYVFSDNVGIMKDNVGINAVTYYKDLYGFTAIHCINNKTPKNIKVFFKKDTVNAQVLFVLKDRTTPTDGIALVKFNRKPKGSKELSHSQKHLRAGDTILLFGYPLGKQETRSAQLLHIKNNNLILTHGVEPGMSGGLATNERGEIIGMIRSSLNPIKPHSKEDRLSLIMSTHNLPFYINSSSDEYQIAYNK